MDDQRARYPRVSDIIGVQTESDMRQIPCELLANASLRGTKVHELCSAYIDNLFLGDVEPNLRPYIDAFIAWYDTHVKELVSNSTRLYDDVKRFTGEFDMIVRLLSGDLALIDIKTSSSKTPSWPVQLAAYRHLCQINDHKVDIVLNLHLKKKDDDVEAKVILYSADSLDKYWEIFQSALTCYDYFKRKGGI